MSQTIPNQLYVYNGAYGPVVAMMPAYNPPPGYQPLTGGLPQLIQLAQQKDPNNAVLKNINVNSPTTADFNALINTFGQQGYIKPDQLQTISQGGTVPSGYSLDDNGTFMQDNQLKGSTDLDAQVTAGTMKKIALSGGGYGYVPTGTADYNAPQNQTASKGQVSAQTSGASLANLNPAPGGSTGGLPLQFYLAPDGRTVTDAQGNYISKDDYLRITGQTGIADKDINWSFVQQNPAPSGGQGSGGAGNNTGGAPSGLTSTGDPTLDGILSHLNDYVTGLTNNGQQINPNIQLTPQDVQKFLDQATSEISPYYASQITAIKDQLTQNLGDLQKQYDLNKQSDEASFKSNLASKREAAAGNGLTFSGVRGQQEDNLVAAETNKDQQAAETASNAAQKAISSTEQQIGTRNLAGLNFPGMTEYTASNAGEGSLNAGRTLPFSTGLSTGGDVTGTQQYDQNRDITNLSNFYQQSEVAKRSLNFNPA